MSTHILLSCWAFARLSRWLQLQPPIQLPQDDVKVSKIFTSQLYRAVICVDSKYASCYFRLPSFSCRFCPSFSFFVYTLACNLSSKQGTTQECVCRGDQGYHLHTDRKKRSPPLRDLAVIAPCQNRVLRWQHKGALFVSVFCFCVAVLL